VRRREREPTQDTPQATIEPPAREEPTGLLALQRSAGNAAVARALARRNLQRVGGWKGVGSKSPNAGEMSITDKGTGFKARRIPIDGIKEANQADDLDKVAKTETLDKGKETERKVEHKTREYTSESSAGGKAIVVIPEGIALTKDTSVDVLLHLHGHTTGYRQSGRSARDINVEHIEEQVAAAAAGKRALIAVLPQGQFKSIFGKGGTKSFDPTDYLDSVWKILTDIGAWPEAPKRGGLMLSGHSGADVGMEDMMDKARAAGTGEVAGLKALFLLDTMFGPNDAKRVLDFVKFRLARDLASVSNLPDENARIAWIQANGFRLRGAHSGGHYKPQMKQLADGIKAWLADTAAVPPALSSALAANIVIDPPGTPSGGSHDAFVGEKENLRKALEMVP
jgi:hypothetical protein